MSFRSKVKKLIPKELFAAVEPYGHLVEAVIYNVIYGFPGRGMKVIGVTGTNGKTTTSFLIHRMLHEAGIKTGLMTTVGFGIGDDINPQVHHMTNVGIPELMKRLRDMKEQGVEWLVLETTSHALAQNRVWGVPYSVAVFTNITHEHLDYHKTFERYRAAKLKLFTRTNRNLRGMRLGIVNAEDPSASIFLKATSNRMSYGVEQGDVTTSDLKLSPSGVSYTAEYSGHKYRIRCNIPGKFNVSNSLAAVCVGIKLGLKPAQIEEGIAALEGVEGRMTRITEGQEFDVIVDFAHTPDSFEKLFKDLKPVVKGKLIVMFGSAGRRDEAKRAVQGQLAGEYCDEVIITEEDDRDMFGMEIMEQISEGAKKAGKVMDQDLFLVHDRAEAINFTVKRARKGDTVLLLGKGHEKTIERANGENPWDEIATVKDALQHGSIFERESGATDGSATFLKLR